MSTATDPRVEAELDEFLARKSSLTADYASLEKIEPAPALDAEILALAKASIKRAPASAAPKPAAPVAAPSTAGAKSPPPARPAPARQPAPEDDADDEAPPARRMRWLVPAVAAVLVLVAAGVGLTMFGGDGSGTGGSALDGSIFARRARDRSEAEKAARAAAEEAAQAEDGLAGSVEPMPPPPFFDFAGPRVQDLDAAIALIRRELLVTNPAAVMADDPKPAAPEPAAPESVEGDVAVTGLAGVPVNGPGDVPVEAPVEPSPAVAGVIQSRGRRLAKILELYDGGQQELAADSLEIFLRDFEDDPISQRILAIKP